MPRRRELSALILVTRVSTGGGATADFSPRPVMRIEHASPPMPLRTKSMVQVNRGPIQSASRGVERPAIGTEPHRQ